MRAHARVCVLQRPKHVPPPHSRSLMTKLVDFNMDRNRLRLACPLGKAGKKEPLPVSFLTRVATALGIDPFSTGQPSPPREGSPRPHSGVPAPALRGELGASTWKGF